VTRRTACGIPALCLVSLLATGAPALADPIDDYIQHEMTARRIPGPALAVARHGKITKMQGYGLANLEHGVAVTSDTVFELASVGKQFTATAIMVLVEAGKVQLDESILAYLSGGPEAWKAITVRHLLTHTSGLPAMGEGFKSLNASGAR
jgi:CubicO group peptidase (beta-lactamase class C family)